MAIRQPSPFTSIARTRPITERLPHGVKLASTKMGIHEWSYSNDFNPAVRRIMPHVDLASRFKNIDIEVELGFTAEQTLQETERCLNCDIQTVFTAKLCIECDACIDICPVDCLTITRNGEEEELRNRFEAPAHNTDQDLYVSEALPQTGRVMVKDENVCVHCGLVRGALPDGRLGHAEIHAAACPMQRTRRRVRSRSSGRA